MPSSLFKPEKEVSLLSAGTENIQEVHQGQVVFGSHSCRLLLGGGPSAHLLSDRQIHPHCLKTNEPIHLEGSHWQTRGRSTALMPGRARGNGCLDLRSSSAPLSAPTLLHLLSLEGNWRQTRVGEKGTMAGGQECEDGTSMPSPAWILWTGPQGLMTRQRTAAQWSAQMPTETCRDLLLSESPSIPATIVGS